MDFHPISQEEIINADCSARTIVNAGPGTGKTYTLIERVKYLLKKEDVDPSGISILCFSRAAVRVVRERLEFASERGEISRKWFEIDLRSIDSFATYLLLWAQSEELINGDISQWDYDERIHQAVLLLNKYGKEMGIMSPYRHIFVDEIQDLVNDRVDFVMALLKNVIEINDECGFTLFGDLCQAIYDYSAEDNKTSEFLYKRLFDLQLFDSSTTYRFYELNKNHRQSAKLQTILAPYRENILKGNVSACVNVQNQILKDIPQKIINFSKFRVEGSGSVGILTRTNAEALVISGWLKQGGTPHKLVCHTTKKFALGDWVGRIILSHNGDSISQKEFEQLFCRIYPNLSGKHIGTYWKSLIGNTESVNNDRYKISSILKGFLGMSKDLCLMDCVESDDCSVFVSCIHQAKGLEYDSVIILDNIFDDDKDGLAFDASEHKVHYVALTRPKSELVCTHMARQYIRILKNKNRRCFSVDYRFNKKGSLSRVEVGESCDINELTLALWPKSQDYIRNTLMPGEELILRRCNVDDLDACEKRILKFDKNELACCYRISPAADESVTLGYTSKKFNEILVAALRQMWKLPYWVPININQLPPCLKKNVQVENIVTYVAPNSVALPEAKSFDGVQMWQGFSMSGFAWVYSR